ncbi:MAG TPA: amidohydrolase family protein [Gaiellaceae bacterium]|nr:amidohydrolase family protein [Gaiellaceae bacterium]
MILRNGTIRTLDPSLPTVSSLWIAGERIAGGVGVHETELPTPETVDLGGRCVLPGFTDSHVHFATWALARRDVGLHDCASLAEALDRVRAAPREGSWLRGQGWRDAEWPDGLPTRQALDAIERERPAMLISKDYHALWLNSAALALAGGDLEVEGGVVVRDEAGEPTGLLYERAAWQFKERYAQAPDDEYVEAMREGVRVAAARGVTAVHDKDGWLGAIGLWQRLEQQGALPLRVWQSTPADRLADLREIGVRSGVGSPLLRLGYLKTFMDGTLGSQTAWMDDGSGVVITTSEELEEIVREGAEAGWPVGVHAIGDAANAAALDAFERSRDVWQPRGLRQRIEHAQCLAPEDVGRFAELGISASVQFSHAPSDEELARRFWADRLGRAYSFRSLLDSGALLANGSDAPVEELEPWAGVVAAVLDHWRDDQRLTLAQALHAVCVAPPWLSHDERLRGTLVPGRYADLVVLDRDPFECEPEELRAVQVVATMLAGRWTHNPPPWD